MEYGLVPNSCETIRINGLGMSFPDGIMYATIFQGRTACNNFFGIRGIIWDTIL